MDNNILLKKADLQKIAREGSKIYEQIKKDYDPQKRGQFLAIEIESEKVYLGKTSADALNLARKNHPQKVFFVIKIGFEAAETVAKLYLK
jgi:hypothetical protein